MDRTERFYRIEQLLSERHVVPLEDFLRELEVSKATFKRDLEYLRDRLNAPIIWDRDAGGYRFEKGGVGTKFELPGLWFNASEIHALLTMQQLLQSLGPGLLTPHIEPLLARLRLLLDSEKVPLDTFEKRIRIQRLKARTYEPEHFLPVVTAVLQKKRLVIEHYNKFRDETTRREVSPQRLNHYQENWYLDAWCHVRNELRRFALDALRDVQVSTEPARDIPEAELLAALDTGYGIFSGKELEWAELAFSGERARWVSKEIWHPAQTSWQAADGTYHLKVPFTDKRELSMDILRHVPEVTIVSPDWLREHVKVILQDALVRL
ncbi:helix-turn-helix transcriptional regulator [Actimicrobium sp. CCI2.3]|uniref:helix-turn-helix transcriptional regulator n=1 Tax=Actimicrobium sp. CCI2.3 TaxID=3048616 RepID=UPI002AB3E0D5|nr:WYL domain-containing protein [Actimicrobium sp. CCI2.3]MDY7574460.1 WYL domain-containing protein [Actimicrobium sp. CCI2.3]MEB0022462.1 WYL domain-containing protein [Actimicrobium sp. CCI2.3]